MSDDGDGDSRPEIRELDAATVERIAAGEVVERPASAVKELVENALDAGADRVEVAVEEGGREGVTVRDDGHGMTEAEVRRAVREHTTSKIRGVEDLDALSTLGFRGEALHAIGAVSRLTIRTRPPDGRGTELRVEGGEVVAVEPAGCPEGTTVEVADLFYNVPARRRYLKRPATEFDHVARVVTGYALANPDVAVALEHDGRERFATPGRGNLRGAVLETYGREVASAMIDVDHRPDGPVERVHGLVSHPETNRASREYLSTFVNGRYVTSAAVRGAVVDAYGDQLGDRYPFAAVFLELDPAAVDANVHPRKLEVRFAESERVRAAVREAVEAALLDAGLLRSGAPRGASAPDETAVRPGDAADAPDDTDGATASGERTGAGDADAAGVETGGTGADAGGSGASGPDADSGGATGAEAVDASGDPAADAGEETNAGPAPPGAERSDDPADGTEPSAAPVESDATAESGRDPDRARAGDRFDAAGALEQARLGGERPASTYERLPDLRVLGQLHDTYLVCETEDGLVLVDQHAADERINYERLREALSGEVTAQALAEPVRVELTAREAALFEAHGEALARLGFHAGLVDDGEATAVEVGTVPAALSGAEGPALVRDVLAAFTSGEPAAADTVAAAVDDLLADLACYPSVTANTSLTEGSVLDLLTALDGCENPYACPHGRPTVIEISTDELEDRFERDYPGHG